MRYSQSFLFTQKDQTKAAESASQDLIARAGLAQQVVAGHFTFLPLGTKILLKIQNIIREEMERAGAQEIVMPIMQPDFLWEESGRWDIYGEEMFKLKNRSGRQFCLGPTHEELIVSLVRSRLTSYKQLPFTLFQFGTKFRDEIRARGGLLRAREFLMKDAYSFDVSDEGANLSYAKMREAYLRILKRTGVHTLPIKASAGEIGGSFSEEFIAPTIAGEDKFVVDSEGQAKKLEDVERMVQEHEIQTGIEICHIFKLGTRYSKAMNLTFTDADGHEQLVIMGCYGIGGSRMIPTIIEQNHDQRGIIWPREVAPYEVALIPLRYDDSAVREKTDEIYTQMLKRGIEVLLDDRDVSPGMKFNDADLLGIPFKIILGTKSLKEGTIECEQRSTQKKDLLDLANIVETFMNYSKESGRG